MSVAVPGSAPETFEIKSASLPLVALLLKSADLEALARDLAARLIPDFFDQDAMVIDLSRLEPAAAAVDFARLLALLRPYRVVPVAVRGGRAEHTEAALAAGLVCAPDARVIGPSPAAAAGPVREVEAEPPAPAALVVDKPLRSGQQLYARGRDLVVLAMVNAGAEVIADGHIHVYAPLRGRAIAGARGNAEARIFSLSLEPELISIAGIYRTGEAPLPASVRGKPAQVRLDQQVLLDRLGTVDGAPGLAGEDAEDPVRIAHRGHLGVGDDERFVGEMHRHQRARFDAGRRIADDVLEIHGRKVAQHLLHALLLQRILVARLRGGEHEEILRLLSRATTRTG
ncbi:MAG: septum site-determining protein MinC [Betaproteobacteria bacterium RIFCSPLOWO2_12_FULL_66_14]|nr:MAG: septum site-determining protein MinC [Betaproteobacteria bacterium RIFCSPLOWO2_12_FULL_66_14]